MRALVSVSDKTGIIEFCKALESRGYEIVSTGGTLKLFHEQGINAVAVEEVTGFAEILDGRVKTLHPHIHGGILYCRDKKSHLETVEKYGIKSIDIVVVNLYPFEENLKKGLSEQEMIELIDIGGPSMIRSAAKNFHDVLVVTNPEDYQRVITSLDEGVALNKEMALKAFQHTSHYDQVIFDYFSKKKKQKLRYGENPHQEAFYEVTDTKIGFNSLQILHGKELSYNNYLDVNAALNLLCEFKHGVIFSLKHSNPCSIAIGDDLLLMYEKVYKGDSISIFGGIVATNLEVTKAVAEKLNEIFLEIVIAPKYSDEALAILKKKKNLRIIKLGELSNHGYEVKSVMGGKLVQSSDDLDLNTLGYKVVGNVTNELELETIKLAYKAVKHVKSNAIVVATDQHVVGVGAGQMNRLMSAKIALKQASEYKNLVLASDAFFPFPDIVELCGDYDVKTIVQPGGSINDQKVIERCNELGISLIFTGQRVFKH